MAKKHTGWRQALGKSLGKLSGVLTGATSSVGLWRALREPSPGAWQRGLEFTEEETNSYPPIFACLSLIAGDVSKLSIEPMGFTFGGVWARKRNTALEVLLARPNPYQNRIQFVESWVLSKLSSGNTYVLIERVAGIGSEVKALHILNPQLVRPMVAESGAVYYELSPDNLTNGGENVTVPASEIIHDRFNCLYHPLVGVSPLWACAVAGGQGLIIQRQQTKFVANGALSVGVLSAPGDIGDDEADRLKRHWEENYMGAGATGKIAVLGNGLRFDRMSMTAMDSQLVEQLKWTVEIICMAFKVPPYMIGYGDPPAYGNIQAANQQYYSQCLQVLIEAIELCLDQGLNLPNNEGLAFDVSTLLRMDSKTQMEVLSAGTGAGVLKLNEARRALGYEPMVGGGSAFMQQQNYSVAALAERDKRPDLWDKPAKTAPAPADDKDATRQRHFDMAVRMIVDEIKSGRLIIPVDAPAPEPA